MTGKDNSSLRFTLGHSCEGRTRVGWRSPGASMISLMLYSLCCIMDTEAVSVPFPVLVSRSEKRWWNKVKAQRMRLLKFSSVFAVMTMSAKNKWNKQTNKHLFMKTLLFQLLNSHTRFSSGAWAVNKAPGNDEFTSLIRRILILLLHKAFSVF